MFPTDCKHVQCYSFSFATNQILQTVGPMRLKPAMTTITAGLPSNVS